MCLIYQDRHVFLIYRQIHICLVKEVSKSKKDRSINICFLYTDRWRYPLSPILISASFFLKKKVPVPGIGIVQPLHVKRRCLFEPAGTRWESLYALFTIGSVFCDSFQPLPINLKTKQLTTLVRRMPSNKAICIRKLRQNTTNLTNLPYWPSSWLEAIATCKTFQRRVPARPVLRHVPNQYPLHPYFMFVYLNSKAQPG